MLCYFYLEFSYVNSRCPVTDCSTLKELIRYQHFLSRVVYLNAIRGIRFLLSPLFASQIVLTILIFARNVTEVDLQIEPRPVSM